MTLGKLLITYGTTFQICKVGIIIIAGYLSGMLATRPVLKSAQTYLEENCYITTKYDNCYLWLIRPLNLNLENGFIWFSEFAWPLLYTYQLFP